MNPAEWLLRTANFRPHAPALMCGSKIVADYSEFYRRAAAIAYGLLAMGVTAGDRVAIFMKNRTQYLEILYGTWFISAVVVPINAKLHPKEAAWIIEDSAAKILFTSDDYIGDIKSHPLTSVKHILTTESEKYEALRTNPALLKPSNTASDGTLWLFYTSGTTGKPKGVTLTAQNLMSMSLCYLADVDSVQPDDAILYAAPLSHGAGLYNFVHILRGARHVVPESGGFDAEEVFALAKKVKNISMFAAPTMVCRLVNYAREQNIEAEGIKSIIYGGGPMYTADIIDAVDQMGARFIQIYGQGECPMAITALSRDLVADRSHPRWRERLSSVGLAQSGVKIRIVDENGGDLEVDEIGEILISGITVMRGYWKNSQATEKTIVDDWLYTGDMGAMDSEGFLTLHDRSKDVIISAGSNIYPREVEEVLVSFADVKEASVIGKPNPQWGEEVLAFIVTHDGMDIPEADLDAHCLSNIARFKRPRSYCFLPELPKNNYGKVLKSELRNLIPSIETKHQE